MRHRARVAELLADMVEGVESLPGIARPRARKVVALLALLVDDVYGGTTDGEIARASELPAVRIQGGASAGDG